VIARGGVPISDVVEGDSNDSLTIIWSFALGGGLDDRVAGKESGAVSNSHNFFSREQLSSPTERQERAKECTKESPETTTRQDTITVFIEEIKGGGQLDTF
jgi:hypothetical protein